MMKRRTLCICTFVLYLLLVCTMLSGKIQKEMLTQVAARPVVLTEKSRGPVKLPLDAVWERPDWKNTTEVLLFDLSPGTGWQEGLRFTVVSGSLYSMNAQDNTADMFPDKDRLIVRHASRFPEVGGPAEVIEQKETPDQYLVVYRDRVPDYGDHWSGVSLTAEAENVRLLDVEKAKHPFLEDQNQEWLYQIQTKDWYIYSLGTVSEFLNELPKIALVGAILVAMVVLWVQSCILIGAPEEYRRTLIANGILEAALLCALVLLLKHINLPASLLPPENILDFSYYAQELGECFGGLQKLGQAGEPVLLEAKHIKEMAAIIAICGVLTPLLWVLWVFDRHRAGNDKTRYKQ